MTTVKDLRLKSQPGRSRVPCGATATRVGLFRGPLGGDGRTGRAYRGPW